MAPDIETDVLAAGRVRRRNHQPIRLHRAVDLGDIAAHDQASLAGPWRLTGQQLIGPFEARLQQARGGRHIARDEELAVRKRIVDGARKNLHVREQVLDLRVLARPQLLDGFFQPRQIALQHFAIRRRNLDPQRRDTANLFRQIIFRSIRIKTAEKSWTTKNNEQQQTSEAWDADRSQQEGGGRAGTAAKRLSWCIRVPDSRAEGRRPKAEWGKWNGEWGVGRKRRGLCRAGLFHSIDGTERLQGFKLPLDRRAELQSMIGQRAERLAYWNCLMDRSSFDSLLKQAEGPYTIRNRETGETMLLTNSEFDDLCRVHLFDWLEPAPSVELCLDLSSPGLSANGGSIGRRCAASV